jgi:phosphoglycolate phosphatase
LVDLDGALVDTVPGLTAALNRLEPMPPFSQEEVARLIAGNVAELLGRACAARRQIASPRLHKAFLDHYRSYAVAGSRPRGDVLPTLRRMIADGWTIAVWSGQPEDITHTILNGLGFSGLLGAVSGCDTFGVSPSVPQQVLATLAAADSAVDEAVIVGDHAEHVSAARRLGLACIFAGWGYGPLSMAAGASALAMVFSDVHGLAARLLLPQEV